jgi:hypothetical protein
MACQKCEERRKLIKSAIKTNLLALKIKTREFETVNVAKFIRRKRNPSNLE